MSMDTLNQRDDSDRQLRIWLLSSLNMGGNTFYRIAGRFQTNGQTWEVNRRYSEFLALRSKLIKFFEDADDACPGCLNYLFSIKRFEFPKKHIFSSKNPAVVNYRVKALRSFMNLLASWAFSNSPKCPLCGGYAFDLVRNFVVDGAEPMTGSDMDYIRGSISVEAFASSSERPSAFMRPPERRHSWIPASGSATLRAHEERQQQQQPPKPKKIIPAGPKQPDAYDTFNDYLPARPSQRTKTSNLDASQSSHKFSAQRQGGKQGAPSTGFLLYNDDANRSETASFGSVSMDATSSQANKLRKHKSEPRDVSRARDDSFLSFASTNSRTDHETKEGDDDDDDDDVSHHSNMLSSPNALPARSQGKAKAEWETPPNQFFDSFVSDDVVSFTVEPVSDEDRRYGDTPPSEEEVKVDDEDSDDEIDITGVALNSPPPKSRPTARSGENLWQPWELARGG